MTNSLKEQSMRIGEYAEAIAKVVFAPNYYDGPWRVYFRGRVRECSNYTTANAWSKYLQRQYGSWSRNGIAVGKIIR